ncbi:MAG TPA: DegT/DnrJ/EryC1/StrS family aminotransferase, partial [Pyrinomonadaceae bacterium]|nr:DegT/DnrJ/EryC1/StrS family aminotransferase [Pyrinomonadaceae bacterium]
QPEIVLPTIHDGAEPVWHLFVVRVADRERLQSHLKEEGITTGVHYPIPLHRQPAYEDRRISTPLPVTEKAASAVLSLPMYPELREQDIERICSALDSAFAVV